MAEPWPVTQHPDAPEMWIVEDDRGKSGWLDEQAARRYAAMPVMFEAVRAAIKGRQYLVCGVCGIYDGHTKDCPGIAALKAAGEETQ